MYNKLYIIKIICNFVLFFKVMDKTHLVISNSTELLRVSANHIMYIKSDGNYSHILQTGGEMRMVTEQLGDVEKLIRKQLPDVIGNNLVRIGKSLIINLKYIYFIQVPKQQLILIDGQQNLHSLSASKDALKALKDLIEKNSL